MVQPALIWSTTFESKPHADQGNPLGQMRRLSDFASATVSRTFLRFKSGDGFASMCHVSETEQLCREIERSRDLEMLCNI